MAAMLRHTTVNRAACAAAAADPLLLATDLADALVRGGMPFRQAHHVVGELVAAAEQAGKRLDELTDAELRAVSPQLGPETRRLLELATAMKRRELIGAPGPAQVRRQLARWRKRLG
jgi:argininosuccinate lyase